MKLIIQKLGMIVVMLLSFLPASAYDFEVDGMCYNVVSISDLTCEVTYGHNYGPNVTVPAKVTYNGRELKTIRIGESAFADCAEIETITIEEGVETIEAYAFKNCSGIKSLIIPASVVEMKDYSFSGCASLEELYFTDSDIPIEIGGKESLFKQSPIKKLYLGRNFDYTHSNSPFSLQSYEKVIIGGKVTKLSSWTFEYSKIDEIEIQYAPEDLKVYNGRLFDNENSIKKVILDRGYKFVSEWSYGLFSGCKTITNVIIGDNMLEIPDDTFSGCKSLVKVKIGSNLVRIGDYAFSGSGLAEITVNENLTTIDYRAFYDTNIENFKFPRSLKEIGLQAFQNTNLKRINLDCAVSRIPRECFSNCTELESIVFPDSLTTIEDYAFLNCPKITELHLGEKLNYLGIMAFTNSALQTIVVDNPIPPTVASDDCFNTNVYLNAEVYVPYKSKDIYSSAAIWKNFWNIKESEPGEAGVESVTIDNGSEAIFDVYNLYGIPVKKTRFIEDLKSLPSGLYIVNGKKILIK